MDSWLLKLLSPDKKIKTKKRKKQRSTNKQSEKTENPKKTTEN